MNATFVFAYFVMPFVVGALGILAYYLHARSDDAGRHAEAEAKRLEG